MPDPRAAAERFAQAAERGDSDAVYSMLTHRDQVRYGREGTRRLVGQSSAELRTLGRQIRSADTRVEARAEILHSDGDLAVLELEDGQFKVGAAAGLPSNPRTPEAALADLRQALLRRSYAALLRVLSPETRGAVESDVRSLVGGLEHPETLHIKVTGDSAEIEIPGGHIVRLKRDAGVWRVDDFN